MSLTFFLAWFSAYKYAAFYVGAILEGPILMTMAGFMVRMGYVEFWPVFLALIVGDLTADLGWYALGRWTQRKFVKRFGKFFSVDEQMLARTEKLFHRHHVNILFFSKITMGFGFAIPILMTAGMARIPLKKFILLNSFGQAVWTGFLMAVGYFFGNVYHLLDAGLRAMSVVAFVLVVAALLFGFHRYIRQKNFLTLP